MTREITPQPNEFRIPRGLAEDKSLPTNVFVIDEVVRRSKSGKAYLLKFTPVAYKAEHCHRCGKKIDDPVSREIGFGPICCEKLGLPRPTIENVEEWLENARQLLSGMHFEEWIPTRYLPGDLKAAAGGSSPENSGKPSNPPTLTFVEGGMVLAFNDAFSMDLVNELKSLVPYAKRSYNGKTREWTVKSTAMGPDLKGFIERVGFQIHGVTPEKAEEIVNETVEEYVAPVDHKSMRQIAFHDGSFYVRWDREDPCFNIIKDTVKTAPGRKFNEFADGTKGWMVPETSQGAEVLRFLVDEWGFTAPTSATDRMDELVAQTKENLELSQAADGVEIDVELPEGLEPLPFQKGGVAYAVKNKRVFIADEMGLGKTVQAIIAAASTQAFPVVVVSPNTLKINWQREFSKWLPDASVEVLSGRKNNGAAYTSDVTVINYDVLANGWTNERKKEIVLSDHARALVDRGIGTLIFDESHYIKNPSSQRSKAAEAMAEGVENVYMLTGTATVGGPIDLAQQLKVMGRLDEFGGFWNFAKRYCDAYKGRFGMVYGASNLLELNEKLRATCFVRRVKADVLTELPAKRRGNVYLEMSNWAEYTKAEQDLIHWIRQNALETAESDEEFNALIEETDTPEDIEDLKEQFASMKAQKAANAEHLVRFAKLKKLTAEGKLKSAIEWVDNFTNPEKGNEKLILFAIHDSIIGELRRVFPDAAYVVSSLTPEERQAQADRFQDDPDCKLFIGALGNNVTSSPAGVGLTLTAASNVAFLELGWDPSLHNQGEDRAHRIGQADSVNTYYLVAEKTMDETMQAIIQRKQTIVEQVLDGKTPAENTGSGSVVKELTESFMRR